jgi:hypothetical protein
MVISREALEARVLSSTEMKKNKRIFCVSEFGQISNLLYHCYRFWLLTPTNFCISRRVGLTQLVRFLVVKLIHSDLNPKFYMSVAFTDNYSFSGRRHLHR